MFQFLAIELPKRQGERFQFWGAATVVLANDGVYRKSAGELLGVFRIPSSRKFEWKGRKGNAEKHISP